MTKTHDERRHTSKSNFRDFYNTTSIETRRKKVFITHMQDSIDTNTYDGQGLRMFAEFCEVLFTSTTKVHKHEDNNDQPQHTMTPFTVQELNNAINKLKEANLQTREVSTRK